MVKESQHVLDIAKEIAPHLAGKPPELQGAVLAELLSMWLAGHQPAIREEMLARHIEHVRPLITVNAAIIRGER